MLSRKKGGFGLLNLFGKKSTQSDVSDVSNKELNTVTSIGKTNVANDIDELKKEINSLKSMITNVNDLKLVLDRVDNLKTLLNKVESVNTLLERVKSTICD